MSTPSQQADAQLAQAQALYVAKHRQRVAKIAQEIATDPVRLASCLRGADSDALVRLCEALIEKRSYAVALALSAICDTQAHDEV